LARRHRTISAVAPKLNMALKRRYFAKQVVEILEKPESFSDESDSSDDSDRQQVKRGRSKKNT
jgi:hypothetical protein